MSTHTKVLVIGGGPAGATVAALLAKEGVETTIFEREFFPRYHIGESLIVSVQETLDLLGVKSKVRDHGFLVKSGAILNWGEERWTFDWAKLPGRNKSSFQVKREEFDTILLTHAKECGSKVMEGVTVSSIAFEGDRPVSVTWTRKFCSTASEEEKKQPTSGTTTFDYLIDCTGRNGILCTKYLKCRVWNNAFKNIAVWSYYKGVKPHESQLQNPIVVNSISEGWIWVIPLHDGTCSVGVVMRSDAFNEKRETRSKEDIFHTALAESAPVMNLLENATQVAEVKSEGDYSYHSNTVCGPHYFVCGDAACFLDPLLSTGCHLAMYSATLAAATLLSLLRGEVNESEAYNFYTKSYLQHFVRWVIVVASFSNIKLGKESYFWHAQSLITDDFNAKNESSDVMRLAFTKMVSGMEDIKEVQDKKLLDEFSVKLRSKLQNNPDNVSLPHVAMGIIDENRAESLTKIPEAVKEVDTNSPMFMDTVVDNLEMVTTPTLGLKRLNVPTTTA
jgi:flavin-dependent dehydrogenase